MLNKDKQSLAVPENAICTIVCCKAQGNTENYSRVQIALICFTVFLIPRNTYIISLLTSFSHYFSKILSHNKSSLFVSFAGKSCAEHIISLLLNKI